MTSAGPEPWQVSWGQSCHWSLSAKENLETELFSWAHDYGAEFLQLQTPLPSTGPWNGISCKDQFGTCTE